MIIEVKLNKRRNLQSSMHKTLYTSLFDSEEPIKLTPENCRIQEFFDYNDTVINLSKLVNDCISDLKASGFNVDATNSKGVVKDFYLRFMESNTLYNENDALSGVNLKVERANGLMSTLYSEKAIMNHRNLTPDKDSWTEKQINDFEDYETALFTLKES